METLSWLPSVTSSVFYEFDDPHQKQLHPHQLPLVSSAPSFSVSEESVGTEWIDDLLEDADRVEEPRPGSRSSMGTPSCPPKSISNLSNHQHTSLRAQMFGINSQVAQVLAQPPTTITAPSLPQQQPLSNRAKNISPTTPNPQAKIKMPQNLEIRVVKPPTVPSPVNQVCGPLPATASALTPSVVMSGCQPTQVQPQSQIIPFRAPSKVKSGPSVPSAAPIPHPTQPPVSSSAPSPSPLPPQYVLVPVYVPVYVPTEAEPHINPSVGGLLFGDGALTPTNPTMQTVSQPIFVVNPAQYVPQSNTNSVIGTTNDKLRYAEGSQCTHYDRWKRLRVKKGLNHLLCCQCGVKWRCE